MNRHLDLRYECYIFTLHVQTDLVPTDFRYQFGTNEYLDRYNLRFHTRNSLTKGGLYLQNGGRTVRAFSENIYYKRGKRNKPKIVVLRFFSGLRPNFWDPFSTFLLWTSTPSDKSLGATRLPVLL